MKGQAASTADSFFVHIDPRASNLSEDFFDGGRCAGVTMEIASGAAVSGAPEGAWADRDEACMHAVHVVSKE